MNDFFENIRERVFRGIRWGVVYAIAFSAIAICVAVLNGKIVRNVHEVAAVIIVYWIAGPLAGMAVSLLFSLTRWWLGAGVVGIIAMAPLYAGMRFVVKGFVPWTHGDTMDVFVLSTMIGGLGGIGFKKHIEIVLRNRDGNSS